MSTLLNISWQGQTAGIVGKNFLVNTSVEKVNRPAAIMAGGPGASSR